MKRPVWATIPLIVFSWAVFPSPANAKENPTYRCSSPRTGNGAEFEIESAPNQPGLISEIRIVFPIVFQRKDSFDFSSRRPVFIVRLKVPENATVQSFTEGMVRHAADLESKWSYWTILKPEPTFVSDLGFQSPATVYEDYHSKTIPVNYSSTGQVASGRFEAVPQYTVAIEKANRFIHWGSLDDDLLDCLNLFAHESGIRSMGLLAPGHSSTCP